VENEEDPRRGRRLWECCGASSVRVEEGGRGSREDRSEWQVITEQVMKTGEDRTVRSSAEGREVEWLDGKRGAGSRQFI
jgi:hypothetical protein